MKMQYLPRHLLLKILVYVIGLNLTAASSFAYGSDHPDKVDAGHWPKGMFSLVNVPERIHGYFVNTADVFFFAGDQEKFGEFLKAYIAIEGIVQHKVVVHQGIGEAKSPWDKGKGVRCDWMIRGVPLSWEQCDPNAKGYLLELHIWEEGKIKVQEDHLPEGVTIEQAGAAVSSSESTNTARLDFGELILETSQTIWAGKEKLVVKGDGTATFGSGNWQSNGPPGEWHEKSFELTAASSLKSGFEHFTVSLSSTEIHDRTITIHSDGSCRFEMKKLQPVPGKGFFRYAKEPYVSRYHLSAPHLQELELLLDETEWLAKPAHVEEALRDAIRYSMEVERGGKKAQAVCYGEQGEAYQNLIRFIDRLDYQEWSLYQLLPQHPEAPEHNFHWVQHMQIRELLDPTRVVPALKDIADRETGLRRQTTEEVIERIRSLEKGGAAIESVAKSEKGNSGMTSSSALSTRDRSELLRIGEEAIQSKYSEAYHEHRPYCVVRVTGAGNDYWEVTHARIPVPKGVPWVELDDSGRVIDIGLEPRAARPVLLKDIIKHAL